MQLKSSRRDLWLVVATAIASLLAIGVLRGQSPAPVPLPPNGVDPPTVCGTRADSHLTGAVAPAAILPDGEPLFFDQDPPLVFSDHDGPITLRNFNIVGDYSSVDFYRYDPDTEGGRLETWTRVTSRGVNGRVVSIFEPSWPSSELARTLSRLRFGFDLPDLYWGELALPGTSVRRFVRLRMGLGGIPSSPTIRVNNRVQYASNVVNLVIPGFGDGRVQNGQQGFELSAATRMFYQYFADAYDVIAVQPQAMTVADYGAFHQNVQNDVTGLNLDSFDQTALYGSKGVLRGVELYAGSNSARYEDTNHEMAHQWGSRFDWTRIANIARAGHQPASHAPLWTGGETLIGAVLLDDRRVRAVPGGYEIERTPAPARYHPLEMYAMGKLDAAQVPDFAVFQDQAQFVADTSSSPAVGTRLNGDAQPVSIRDVIRIHGERRGPSPGIWRRALVVVSRDDLASQREIDEWNFFAQRLADNAHLNPPTYNGFAAFRIAAQDTVSLATGIHPLGQPELSETLDTAATSFGPNDWRAVVFTEPVRSRFTVGETVGISGRVVVPEAVDFSQVGLIFYRVDTSDRIRFYGDVRRSGDFGVTIRFSESQRGPYALAVYLFWPGSGSQYPRASVSTVTVE